MDGFPLITVSKAPVFSPMSLNAVLAAGMDPCPPYPTLRSKINSLRRLRGRAKALDGIAASISRRWSGAMVCAFAAISPSQGIVSIPVVAAALPRNGEFQRHVPLAL